jgi:hypothetical protein
MRENLVDPRFICRGCDVAALHKRVGARSECRRPASTINAAASAGNIEGMMAYYAQDVVLTAPTLGGLGGNIRIWGREQVQEVTQADEMGDRILPRKCLDKS